MLIVLAGLPGSGKTTLAQGLARRLGAMHLRIDSIEQTLAAARPEIGDLEDTGYRIAYALAVDNLRLGRIVIADSVNPIALTRAAWREAGRRAGSAVVEVEVVCSDADEHRRRVEGRVADIPGHALPDWQAVLARDYAPWDGERLVVDSADRTPEACVEEILRDQRLAALAGRAAAGA